MDISSINKRFTDFRQSYRNKPYERQKDSLEVQLSSFLSSLVPSKKLSAATAEDIIKLLISKDSAGKQKLNLPSCSRKICDCPKRLAAGTVDSYTGKLRSTLNKLGRTGMSNPLSHPTIKGGAVASWLVCSTPDRVVRVRGLAGDIVLCSWARHFTLTVPLSTQVYKRVPA